MASSRKKSSRSTLIRIVVGAVVIAAGVIIYTSVISQPELPPAPTGSRGSLPSLNTTVLEDESIDSFHSWQSLPLEVGETGRDNPFSQ